MAVKIEVKYHGSVPSSKDLISTYGYLADVEKSVPANFPGLEKFEKRGDTHYWEFEKVSYSGHDIQFKLASKYSFDSPKAVKMSAVKESGYSTMSGAWTLVDKGGKVEATFDATLEMELPIPFFLKAVAAPICQKELTKLLSRYLGNVGKALS